MGSFLDGFSASHPLPGRGSSECQLALCGEVLNGTGVSGGRTEQSSVV